MGQDGQVSDKMRLDSAKIRKMKDVSSVLGPPAGGGTLVSSPNTLASRGGGEG